MYRTNLRQTFGEEILLEPGGEAEFLVEAKHLEVQGFVAAIQEINFLAKVGELGLQGCELLGDLAGGVDHGGVSDSLGQLGEWIFSVEVAHSLL